jgi:hypothetical protein
MSRKLDDLNERFRPLAIELIARCAEAGVPVFIVDTIRTPEEQAANIAKGVSWTKNSKHLTGMAIDICPYETYNAHGPDKLQWDAAAPVWETIARIGEGLGLRAGYRWKQRDCGHFEMKAAQESEPRIA